MANYQCRNEHTWKGLSSLSAAFDPGVDLICPKCGAPNESGMERKARKKAGQRGGRLRDISDAEQAALETFRRRVHEWPCWARKHRPCERCEGRGFNEGTGEVCGTCGGDGKHRCRGRKNAHHLIPLDWIRTHYGDLPEPDFLEIAYTSIIGAPACQHNFHAALEARNDFIYFEELDSELIEFCQRMDARYPDHPSLLARLETESPKQAQEVSP